MRRLKKSIFQGLSVGLILVLAAVRAVNGCTGGERSVDSTAPASSQDASVGRPASTAPEGVHPIYSLRGASYAKTFNDLQDTQIIAARRHGIPPVKDRAQAERRKSELVYVGSSPYYTIDPGMNSSIPYLVPRAADMLMRIAQSFVDSLSVKGIPAHRIIVSSVLRTEDDILRLRRRNGNASPESCHRFGTTIDIAYNRYHTVCPPGEIRREVRSDTLKMVLGEVLKDLRDEGRCYVKHELKQGCFHITTR